MTCSQPRDIPQPSLSTEPHPTRCRGYRGTTPEVRCRESHATLLTEPPAVPRVRGVQSRPAFLCTPGCFLSGRCGREDPAGPPPGSQTGAVVAIEHDSLMPVRARLRARLPPVKGSAYIDPGCYTSDSCDRTPHPNDENEVRRNPPDRRLPEGRSSPIMFEQSDPKSRARTDPQRRLRARYPAAPDDPKVGRGHWLPSQAGRTADRSGNGVGSLCPGDLEVVVLWVTKVRRRSPEELSVDWLLCNPGAGVAHLVGQRVHALGGIECAPNAEPDPARAGIRFASPSAASCARGNRARTTTRSSKAAKSSPSITWGQPRRR